MYEVWYDGEDKLYFKSYRMVKSLFKHLEDYYRIAISSGLFYFKWIIQGVT